jgi:hypothetical protein
MGEPDGGRAEAERLLGIDPETKIVLALPELLAIGRTVSGARLLKRQLE